MLNNVSWLHVFTEFDLTVMVITPTSNGIILLALVEKSELNWANLKAPQDGGQEVEEEKNHISISAACEAAEERDDKCCGAARLLSAYRLKSSRCCSAAEFRRRGTRSPPTLASKQKCYLRRGTIRPPREPPPLPTCNHHSCSRRSWKIRTEKNDLTFLEDCLLLFRFSFTLLYFFVCRYNRLKRIHYNVRHDILLFRSLCTQSNLQEVLKW